jgi:uncharacterized membrane protein
MHTPHELAEFNRRRRRTQDRVSDRITQFSGSMLFVYVHVVWFAAWIVVNELVPNSFDPFPFGLLTLIVSLQAIFLSTFVLISQNRETMRAELRSELDFETNVRAEVWVEAIASKLGIDPTEVRADIKQRLATADAEHPDTAMHAGPPGSRP